MAHLTIRQTQRQFASVGSCPPATEQLHFIQSDRRRDELQGWSGYGLRPHGRTTFRLAPRTALITRCDVMRAFHLNLEDREYTTWPLQTDPTRQDVLTQTALRDPVVLTREPTLLVETETVDTGERKELFGRPARHVIATTLVTSLRDATGVPRKTVTDGWYIDLVTHVSCDPWRSARSGQAIALGYREGEERDVPVFRSVGTLERGYALLSKTTSYDTIMLSDGSTKEHISVVETEVTHLSTAELDPAIFEVPSRFRLVEAIRQDPAPPLSIRWKQAYERMAHRFRGTN